MSERTLSERTLSNEDIEVLEELHSFMHKREVNRSTLAAEVLAHIREDDKTPEQGADDYDLVGDQREQVIEDIHSLTSYDCDGDGRIPKR